MGKPLRTRSKAQETAPGLRPACRPCVGSMIELSDRSFLNGSLSNLD